MVSSKVADFIASLRHSFVVEWDASMLYIACVMVEILDGYEMPGPFDSWSHCGLSCLLWCWIKGQVRQSLYFALFEELKLGQRDVSPNCITLTLGRSS